MKKKIDQVLLDKGLAKTKTLAQALVLSGFVLMDDVPVDKLGTLVHSGADIRLREEPPKYASRGGLKLEKAFQFFQTGPKNKICLDVGASTGGFTDCLLQNGASKVYAVDVGYGQLAWKLRQDKRVVVMDRTNIRHLEKEKIPDKMNFIVIDVSFISLKIVFASLKKFLDDDAEIIALIKPQFEVGKKEVGRKGIVKDPILHLRVKDEIRKAGESQGWHCRGLTDSPIEGAEGNREFLICFEKGSAC